MGPAAHKSLLPFSHMLLWKYELCLKHNAADGHFMKGFFKAWKTVFEASWLKCQNFLSLKLPLQLHPSFFRKAFFTTCTQNKNLKRVIFPHEDVDCDLLHCERQYFRFMFACIFWAVILSYKPWVFALYVFLYVFHFHSWKLISSVKLFFLFNLQLHFRLLMGLKSGAGWMFYHQ